MRFLQKFYFINFQFNRVGSKGLFPLLSSHTTVRTGLVYGGLLE